MESSRCRRDRRGLAEGGTYNNPIAGQGLTGEAIGSFARGVFAAYPDASFELISIGDTGGGLVAFKWLARGTNKIRSEHVCHDRQIMAEQLGATATEPA